MFHSLRARVGTVFMAVVLLAVLVVPAASAGTAAAPSESSANMTKAGGYACYTYYIVRRGDNLTKIAYRFGTTVNQLMRCNNIWNPDVIYIGQRLCICKPYTPPPPPKPKPQPCWQQCGAPCGQPCPAPQPCMQQCGAPCGQPCPAPQPQPCMQQCGAPCGQPCPAPQPGPCGSYPCPAPQPQPWPPVHPPSCTVAGTCCTDTRSVITSPRTGQSVSGWVTVYGTAVHQDFDYYKLEYGAGSNPSEWSWFYSGEQQVGYGPLGTFNAAGLPCGTYTIRLTVVDSSGNYPPQCQVTVTVR